MAGQRERKEFPQCKALYAGAIRIPEAEAIENGRGGVRGGYQLSVAMDTANWKGVGVPACVSCGLTFFGFRFLLCYELRA